MRVYVDGSALTRFLADVRGSGEWRAWVHEHGDQLLVSQLSVTELRVATLSATSADRVHARDQADALEVVRFSDQAIGTATTVTGVLSPFAALHLGVAVAHPEVRAVATYHGRLATVAAIHGLDVVAPGLRPGWWDGP
ncbi:hypothetical protein ACGIF2_11405 [Cellulomonas sp. P22]|uniref:hypothetical protein n=1 Tax=Cellulomonas sp. P22 TaxID=3373189 RepID=UPI0037B24AB3